MLPGEQSGDMLGLGYMQWDTGQVESWPGSGGTLEQGNADWASTDNEKTIKFSTVHTDVTLLKKNCLNSV